MARKPYYRKALRAWYILKDGKQVRLGKEKDEAFREYHRIMAGGEIEGKELVGQIIHRFLNWVKVKQAPLTHDFYKGFLLGGKKVEGFIALHGTTTVTSLKPYHVDEWVQQRGFQGTTENRAISAVLRCFNWAAKKGLIDKNPLKGMERPMATNRECDVTKEQWEAILATVKGPFRDFLLFARATGARPQEIRAIEKRHFRNGAITFPAIQSKGKKVQRVITLTPSALKIVERLAEAHPVGPIFRNRDGEPWTRHAINCASRRLSKKVGFPFFVYALRHAFATNAIENGVNIITLAGLMGHKDTRMLATVYARVSARSDHMKEAAAQAAGESLA